MANNGQVKYVFSFIVVNINLRVDANFDSVISTADDAYKNTTGGLVGWQDGKLEPLGLFVSAPSTTGNATLSAVSGGDKIRIWPNNSTNGSPISLPATWSVSAVPSTLYVEGVNLSAPVGRDVALQLTYNYAGVQCQDQVVMTVTSNSFTLIVDQPGNGDVTAWERVGGHFDVGHSFYRFETSHPTVLAQPPLPFVPSIYVNTYIGYYPDPSASPISPSASGFLSTQDTDHLPGDVRRTWRTTPKQLIAGLTYSRSLVAAHGTFNLYTHNCTDVAIGAGLAAGLTVPTTTHYLFSIGNVHIPGYYGVALTNSISN